MRLLITGGAGFIGANFVHYWARRHDGDRLVVLDALTYAGNRASLPELDEGRLRFVQGDIRQQADVEALLREEEIDTIVHFAAESHVDRSIAGPEHCVAVNVLGTLSLLEAARCVWLGEDRVAHRFHHVSTDEVYGSLSAGQPAFTETTPYAPNSPYAASKAAADHLVRAYHETYGLATTISNCSINYGPYHFPEKLIPLFIVNLLEGRDLPVYGEGINVRDWLHVDDHCRGIESILAAGSAGELYNVGSRNERGNLEVVKELCKAVDVAFAADSDLATRFPAAPPAHGAECASRIRFVRDRPGHDLRYAIDPSKLEKELGFAAEVDFASGLRQTVQWYLAHETWWRAILARGSYREWVDRQYGDAEEASA
ncbi:MAG: dTDP-glucose 4,6-dehydratase [Acidobacteria bacterium]|nr:dTDP-glucose 4,6-dehydratase [Acidobacteriota bacterium]